jgi:hypothetical protein
MRCRVATAVRAKPMEDFMLPSWLVLGFDA